VLYLDSSALVKLYVLEKGSASLEARLRTEDTLFSSILTYAEIHAVLARKLREKAYSRLDFGRASRQFVNGWLFAITKIDLESNVVEGVRRLLFRFPLTGADAVHLATALWIRDKQRLTSKGTTASELVFAAADKQLLRAAEQNQFKVYNPEDHP